LNSGLATPPDRCSVSIAACMMKKKCVFMTQEENLR
jgi:hypothetical protein